MLQPGFVGTTRKRSSCDPAKGAASEQHMVLEQVSSGQCWLWRGKLPLLSRHAMGHVPAGYGTSIGSHGTSFITRALPCLKEEGLILANHLLLKRGHSVWRRDTAKRGAHCGFTRHGHGSPANSGQVEEQLGAQERGCTALPVSVHGHAWLLAM